MKYNNNYCELTKFIVPKKCHVEILFLQSCFFLQLQIYSSSTHQVNKSFTRFKDKVYCGSFRHDGKLLITGEENGTVQVLQMFLR